VQVEVPVPFRGIEKDVKFGEPVKLLTAGPRDVHVQIRARNYGATGVSGGPNFLVGGPDIAGEGGLICFDSAHETDLAAGDELWVAGSEQMAWADSFTITALIRSVPDPDAASGEQTGDAASA
jgi:hypothetical protein